MSGTYSDLLNAQHASNALAAIANPGQVNILGAYNAAAQTGANMLNLQKLQAEKAVGGAAQGAIDPTTGEYDPNRFRQNLVAAGPQAAMGAQAGLLNNQSLSNDQLTQARAKLAFVQSRAGALLDKPTITPQDVLGVFQQGIASGVMTMPEVARQMQVVQGLDAAGLRQWAQQHQLAALQTENQINQIYPNVGTQTGPGGATVPVLQQPGRKGGAVGQGPGAVQQGLPATQLDAPFDYLDEKGAKQQTTLRQWYIDHGYSFPASGGPGGAPGALPSSLRNPAAAAPTAAATPQPGPAPVQTSPSAADLAQQRGAAETSVAGFRDISQKAVASRDRSSILGNMLGDVSQFTTGPLAGVIGKTRNMGIALGVPGLNVEGQSAQESFNKLAAQLANAQGAGSDGRMMVNIEANPHQELSPAGATLMIHQLQGNEDYLQARAQLAQAFPDQKNVNKFETEVGKRLDPRAFQFSRMSVPERQTYVKNLSVEDYKKVQKAYNEAASQGWLPGG
jgi:hypothetical protein